MNLYNIYVCDDLGNPEYKRTIKAKTLREAEDKAFLWAMQVEANEGWFTTYRAEAI